MMRMIQRMFVLILVFSISLTCVAYAVDITMADRIIDAATMQLADYIANGSHSQASLREIISQYDRAGNNATAKSLKVYTQVLLLLEEKQYQSAYDLVRSISKDNEALDAYLSSKSEGYVLECSYLYQYTEGRMNMERHDYNAAVENFENCFTFYDASDYLMIAIDYRERFKTPTPSPSPTPAPTPTPTPPPTPTPKLSLKDGQIVQFGEYKETPIEWYVARQDSLNDTATLVCTKAVDVVVYHSRNVSVAWGDCDLRTWLNTTFVSHAFTENEQSYIQTTLVDGSYDRVYILNKFEIESMYKNNIGHQKNFGIKAMDHCYRNDTVTGNSIYVNKDTKFSSWWIRQDKTSGKELDTDRVVAGNGKLTTKVNNPLTATDNGVRPVIVVRRELFREFPGLYMNH